MRRAFAVASSFWRRAGWSRSEEGRGGEGGGRRWKTIRGEVFKEEEALPERKERDTEKPKGTPLEQAKRTFEAASREATLAQERAKTLDQRLSAAKTEVEFFDARLAAIQAKEQLALRQKEEATAKARLIGEQIPPRLGKGDRVRLFIIS